MRCLYQFLSIILCLWNNKFGALGLCFGSLSALNVFVNVFCSISGKYYVNDMVIFSICSLYLSFNPPRPNPGRREKLKLNFYFHTSLWCLKRFYEGLKCLHETFWGTAKKYENKNFTYLFFNATFRNARDEKG